MAPSLSLGSLPREREIQIKNLVEQDKKFITSLSYGTMNEEDP